MKENWPDSEWMFSPTGKVFSELHKIAIEEDTSLEIKGDSRNDSDNVFVFDGKEVGITISNQWRSVGDTEPWYNVYSVTLEDIAKVPQFKKALDNSWVSYTIDSTILINRLVGMIEGQTSSDVLDFKHTIENEWILWSAENIETIKDIMEKIREIIQESFGQEYKVGWGMDNTKAYIDIQPLTQEAKQDIIDQSDKIKYIVKNFLEAQPRIVEYAKNKAQECLLHDKKSDNDEKTQELKSKL